MSETMDIQKSPRSWYVKYRNHIALGAVLIALAAYLTWLAFDANGYKVHAGCCQMADVAMEPFVESVDVEGIVQPISTIQLNALEGGFVERVVAEEGEMLEVGDTVLVLSNPDLLRTIDDEKAEWVNLQRNFQEQEIEMAQKSITLQQQAVEAEHQMRSMEKTLRQNREEYRMGIKSKAELEVAEEDYSYRKKTLHLQAQGLRQDSVAARLKREMVYASRDAALRKLSRLEERTSKLIVRATVAGQLSYLSVTMGQQVAAGASVGELKVLTDYKVRCSLPEYYIDRITTGLPAWVQYQERRFPLRISKVVPEVKDRAFACELVFTGSKPSNMRLGKSYRVQVELGKQDEALVIPHGDFYQATSGRWIYRLSADGKTASKVPVEIGRQNPQQYEVVSGLKRGDRVIVGGYDQLGDRDEIVIR